LERNFQRKTENSTRRGHSESGLFPERKGGLISYGPDRDDQYRHVADYVDRILKGAKPADLPVQASTKFLTVITENREGAFSTCRTRRLPAPTR
jgi:hypothetical protein